MERRKFIRYVGTLGTAFLVAPSLIGCSNKRKPIKTSIIGANKYRGHLIRDNKLNFKSTQTVELETAIVGGGITGLSCAYHLLKNNYSNFKLFELNDEVGGNSSSGKNKHSKFPLGAHYLTLPNPENRPLIEFLKELKLLVKENPDGSQEYSEEHLCHAPDERLLYRGVFQEGLVPNYGINKETDNQIHDFFKLMNDYKIKKGIDRKFLFDIPVTSASKDPLLKEFDTITFKEFLNKNNFNSEELLWFLDYCCRDDFGAGYDRVSAWAGINYFAGRKSNPSNTIPSNVLTWAEGNGYLVETLKEKTKQHIQNQTIVSEIIENSDHTLVKTFNIETKQFTDYKVKKAIIACPSYVTKHILHSPHWNKTDFENYIHHPWLVGIVELTKIPEASGLELCWDNVKYGTTGLGYIYNQHQEFTQLKDKIIINVYLAFDKEGDTLERQKMFSLSEEEMTDLVLKELKGLHPTIEENIESISFQQWGHGMVTPYPFSLEKHYQFREKNSKSPSIRLAHTDYSGYSIFEEGFSQGLEAAQFICNSN